jgi:hypothetical protein
MQAKIRSFEPYPEAEFYSENLTCIEVEGSAPCRRVFRKRSVTKDNFREANVE